jgi:hypothetical protein
MVTAPNAGKDAEKRNHSDIAVGLRNGVAILKNKLNVQLPCDPAGVFLSVYLREIKTYSYKSLHTKFQSSFICNREKLEIIQISFNE